MRRPNEMRKLVDEHLDKNVDPFLQKIDRAVETDLMLGKRYPVEVYLGDLSEVRPFMDLIGLRLFEAGWQHEFVNSTREDGTQWDPYDVDTLLVKVSPIEGEE